MHFSRINEEATIENAKKFLSEYRHYHRIELRSVIALQSPVISGMPSGDSKGNTNEDRVISHLDAKTYCATCRHAIEAIESDTYRKILSETYIKPVYNDDLIMSDVGLEHSRFYDVKNDALIAFAEICPPMPDIKNPDDVATIDLLVYKSG